MFDDFPTLNVANTRFNLADPNIVFEELNGLGRVCRELYCTLLNTLFWFTGRLRFSCKN